MPAPNGSTRSVPSSRPADRTGRCRYRSEVERSPPKCLVHLATRADLNPDGDARMASAERLIEPREHVATEQRRRTEENNRLGLVKRLDLAEAALQSPEEVGADGQEQPCGVRQDDVAAARRARSTRRAPTIASSPRACSETDAPEMNKGARCSRKRALPRHRHEDPKLLEGE